MEQETLRHQYLEALGVSSWLPCAVLPGAAVSADWVSDFRYPAPEIPFESDRSISARAALGKPSSVASPVQVSPTKESLESAQQGMSQARAALGLASEPVVEPAVSTQEQKTADITDQSLGQSVEHAAEVSMADSIEQAQEPPRFKLAFHRIGEILVVDSLPPQGGTFGENYQVLAQAIVSALGMQGERGAVFMLPWPMFASKTLDQGHKQASIAVQHKLSKELQAYSVKAVLLFGEAAAQMVMERQETLDELKGINFEVRSGVKAISSHSLTEAMQLPGIKKQIWVDLQPLLTGLSSS